MELIERKSKEVDHIITMRADIEEMIIIFREIRSALMLFVRIGNALKWLLTSIATVTGLYYLWLKAFPKVPV